MIGQARTDEPLIIAEEREVRWLRLHRPDRRNALDPTLIDALDKAIAAAVDDPNVAIIALAGDGPSFCAGADLVHLRTLAAQSIDPLPYLARIANCCTRIEQSPKPVVAVVHGHVVAGGLELALACDVVIAERGTLIGDGHLRSGLLPAGGSSVRLPRKVGEALARWLILTGELLPAEAFLPSGFVHTVADGADLRAAVEAVITALHRPSTVGQRNGKALLTAQIDASSEAGYRIERDAFAANWGGQHVSAGLTQFADGRQSLGATS